MNAAPLEPLAIDLSAEINAAFASARTHAAAATASANDAVTRALECGRLLNQQKAAMPHGAWQPWLATHCPEICAATARRYMLLAKRARERFLDDGAGLRQAYLATGVLPAAPRASREPDVNTPTVTFVRGLDQFRRWFNRRTDECPLDQWTPDARRLLRNELAWFKKLYDRLGA